MRCKCYYWRKVNNETSYVQGMCSVPPPIDYTKCVECEIEMRLNNPDFIVIDFEEEDKPREMYWFSVEHNLLNPFVDEQDKGMNI